MKHRFDVVFRAISLESVRVQYPVMQVNHLSPMLLTLELLPVLLDTAGSSGDGRIVFVSSVAHTMARSFDPSRINLSEGQYGRLAAYNNSKLYNVRRVYQICASHQILGKNCDGHCCFSSNRSDIVS